MDSYFEDELFHKQSFVLKVNCDMCESGSLFIRLLVVDSFDLSWFDTRVLLRLKKINAQTTI